MTAPRVVLAAALAALACLAAPAPAARAGASAPAGRSPADEYAAFNAFCRDHFGAARQPLAETMFGSGLALRDDGSWQHVGPSSACIAWETTLPARGCVEFGPTADYGSKTPLDERPFYLHVHYLKDLAPGVVVHWRIVSTDERGRTFATPDATFTPGPGEGAVPVPGDLQGPPYNLDRAGGYLLAAPPGRPRGERERSTGSAAPARSGGCITACRGCRYSVSRRSPRPPPPRRPLR